MNWTECRWLYNGVDVDYCMVLDDACMCDDCFWLGEDEERETV